MIITRQKDFESILRNLKDSRRVFLVGCGECAALCGTGGLEQLAGMKRRLVERGVEVTGMHLAKTGCQVLGTKIELKQHAEAIRNADCMISMSCGAGTQTIVELQDDKPVLSANDSLFLGNMTRHQMFDERCSMCGECILDQTGGICPITGCPKGILVGPCGGCDDGMCEINRDLACIWIKIYERMKKLNRLGEFGAATPKPKDWSKNARPHHRITRAPGKKP
ncbi:MAG TPA: methylenetetrahydrofolate reductase C-terminal domain-containing protein [Dissulfurispiraceae bacterium]|nr:methylenetetrahydrofolate reductase C-terminal domain-containing protein [Dissulfurispiraceae bacterium]